MSVSLGSLHSPLSTFHVPGSPFPAPFGHFQPVGDPDVERERPKGGEVNGGSHSLSTLVHSPFAFTSPRSLSHYVRHDRTRSDNGGKGSDVGPSSPSTSSAEGGSVPDDMRWMVEDGGRSLSCLSTFDPQ